MNDSDLKRFARQLSVWAELVIEHGRTPFRRVDLFPQIHTGMGLFQPPVVFWINRQSLMSGGVILLPDNDLPEQLKLGAATAEALGLRHFVTWERDKIRFWDAAATPPREEKQLIVIGGSDPESFRALLLEVMEQLKLLSVLGMVTADKLAPSYLHNLFQETLDSALAPLITAFRETRAEGGLLEATRADRQADQLNRMTLLRMLTLLWRDALPESILPEKLERAMEIALPSLPPELAQPLAFHCEQGTPNLPVESAVCYHHLLLRLRQIRWDSPPERATKAINQFLAPFKLETAQLLNKDSVNRVVLRINPATALVGCHQLYELSDSPPFLAAAALLRFINDSPPARQFAGDLFSFPEVPLPATLIQGKFLNRRRILRNERQRYDALLRTSWPTRRFKMPPDIPGWFLESIHLLGLSQPSAELEVEIPTAWLSKPYGETLWELIMENFQLQKVTLNDGTTLLELVKQKSASMITTVHGVAGERLIAWSEQESTKRSSLLFSLLLTEEQFDLINSDRFQVCSETPAPTAIDTGLLAYSRSTFGQCTWALIGGRKLPSTVDDLRKLGAVLGWPIPDDDILYQLGRPETNTTESICSPERLDQQLVELLDSPALLNSDCPQLPQIPGTERDNRNKASGRHRDEILLQLDAWGLPDFPEQYLYQLEGAQLSTYRFQPPLRVTDELLGRFELVDGNRKKMIVRGETLVEALSLCAEQGRNAVELPDDQQQLAELLSSYREDLVLLRQELNRQTHTRLESPQAAERLAKKLWNELKLPAWSWLDR